MCVMLQRSRLGRKWYVAVKPIGPFSKYVLCYSEANWVVNVMLQQSRLGSKCVLCYSEADWSIYVL